MHWQTTFAVIFFLSTCPGNAAGPWNAVNNEAGAVLSDSESGPDDGRIPLILVHGWNEDNTGWDRFITYIQNQANPLFASGKNRYRIFYFQYQSNQESVAVLGQLLAQCMSSTAADPNSAIGSKQMVIVAHSMGGLVARQFMITNNSSGQPWGNKIAKLITLATPHHGAYLANSDAIAGSLFNAIFLSNPDLGSSYVAELGILNTLAPYSGKGPYQTNRIDLWWDNYTNNPNWKLSDTNAYLQTLNTNASIFDANIIAYAGVLASSRTISPPNGVYAIAYNDGYDVNAQGLGIPSDGIVPEDSALFQGHLSNSQIRIFGPTPSDPTDYTHAEMWQGKGDAVLASDQPVFDQLIGDLGDIANSLTPSIIGISPRTLNAIADAQTQHITINGTGFTVTSKLRFTRLDDNFTYPDVVPQYIGSTDLEYNISDGPTASSWAVSVVDGNAVSDPYTFYVVSNSGPATPKKANSPLPLNEATGQGTKLSLNWTDGGGTASFHLYLAASNPANLASGDQGSLGYVTTFTTPTLTTGVTYYWRVDSVNSAGTVTTGDVWNFTTGNGAGDTVGPAVAIFNPSNGLATSDASVRVNGSASDNGSGNNGVAAVALTVNGVAATVNNGTASGAGTANWDASVTLSPGANVITAVAYDASSNSRSTQIAVTYNPPSPTSTPLVFFTSPASSPASTSNDTVDLAGYATSIQGVNLVNWLDNFGAGGNASITISGNITYWTINGLLLHVGDNTITVSASNKSGVIIVGRGSTTVTYTPPTPIAPEIFTQPVSQAVNAGLATSFTVAASGVPTPAYQWQVSTDGGNTWANVTEDSLYNGTATATLTVNASTTTQLGYQYQALITNLAGTTTTTPVPLIVGSSNAKIAWLENNFSTTQLGNPAIVSDMATPAGDGIPNLLKYALNLNPLVNGKSYLPQPAFFSGNIVLTYPALRADLIYTVEASTDLINWSVIGVTVQADGIQETASYPIGTASIFPQLGTYYQITDLGTINGADTYAYGVNALGHVVGSSGSTAFLWKPDTGMTVITDNITVQFPLGMNDSDQVVGTTADGSGFLWSQGNMTHIVGPGPYSAAYSINNSGTIIGTDSLPQNGAGTNGYIRAFAWVNGTITYPPALGLPGQPYLIPSTIAEKVNASGNIAGLAGDPSVQDYQVVIWLNGGTTIQSIYGSWGSGATLNDLNHVVAYVTTETGSGAFLWKGGSLFVDLGDLGGGGALPRQTVPTAINNADIIVGTSYTSSGQKHAFIWADANGNNETDPGEMLDLNSFLPPNSGWVLDDAEAINDSGVVVGSGLHNGQRRAFIMSLINTPSNKAYLHLVVTPAP